ncbi:DUF429 domain-containing protein [Alkalihalobacterium chitinilyticum]|uniref:DUF429 domain-containing protein n=1 Tax=Alkalihalobacterium chitinilyticum TaxID=2980103 RepID=A0ABT5VI30_9BACI|nr:DUF429 domain-containing protein [Alkalihalobacterium chitinilyticum]MDE5415074.1 DUF429 domain-containing protein [Alkalihalobacterium chitinilyticum]
MIVIGIDLSGPSNHKDTVLTVFETQGAQLTFCKLIRNVSDLMILNEVKQQSDSDQIVVGIDAPLSYQDGGGDRESDRQLRKFIISLGMKSGSIMAPTFNRMVYLSLRGIKLSREIERLQTTNRISIVEVHPGAVIGARLPQIEIERTLTYKQNIEERRYLKAWFYKQGILGLPNHIEEESHMIDSVAAALGAWHWRDPAFQPQWIYPANEPLHPYDFCC